MKTASRTTTVNVRSQLLKPYRQVAKILGVPVASYLETHLQPFLDNLEENSLSYIAEEFCCRSYPSRKSAEAAAERFEAYAIEEKLKGSPNIGTIATSVVECSPGDWSVKVDYLLKAGKGGWKSITTDLPWDEADERDDDQDESDQWKNA